MDVMDGTLDKISPSRAERHPEKAHRPDNPIRRKPDWIRVRAPNSPEYAETKRLIAPVGWPRMCEEADLPQYRRMAGSRSIATFMIIGQRSARAPALSATSPPASRAHSTRMNQPILPRLSASWGLGHVVVTSVDRDDLSDGGAGHFAQVIEALPQSAPITTVEVLTPDFIAQGGRDRDRGRGTPRRVLTTISRPVPRPIRRSGRARAISPLCGCCRA